MVPQGSVRDILADLSRVRQELGRMPNRVEYGRLGKFPSLQITEIFGSYILLIQCWEKENPHRGKRDKQEIRKHVHEHLLNEAATRSPQAKPPSLYNNILVLPDRHKPYDHQDANDFLIAVGRQVKPDLVIDIGDGEDFHGMSFHDTDPDLLSAGYELQAMIVSNKPLYNEFPVVLVCESNHSSMVYRKGLHHGFPRHVLKSYREILEAPEGWSWHHEIVVQMSNGQKCLFAHSYGANVLLASQKRGMSLVQGHHHSKMGIQYWANMNGIFFAAQTGCLIDDAKFAFAYNKLQLERPLLGCLVIQRGIPMVAPMLLDRHGRWVGKI